MEKVKDFANFKPTVFWAWNGDMRDEEIVKSIKAFSEAGIGGLYLHARAGLTIEYLGDEWMHAYRTTIRECKTRGLDIWIYDEQGWPSGFAGGKVYAWGEDYYIKYLSMSNSLDGIDKNRVLAAYIKTGETYQRTDDFNKSDVFVYYSVQEHYVDLLNPAVCEEFIRCTHEVYKREFSNEFGKTIKGVFTDEPQIHVSSRAWSTAIPKAYFERYGENVLDKLYLLFESDNDNYQEFRFKYYNTVRELFLINYTEKIYRWCDENNLLSTGHVAGEEGLCVQAASNTGCMPHYEYFHRPGVDHLGRKLNSVLLLKQIQSVTHQLSKKRVLCETFACTGNGVSFKDLAWIWNYLNIFGVNAPCMSISMYRMGGVRKRDYPVFLSEQQPWWREFSDFNNFVTNSCEFETEGEYDADVLLLSAINSALCEPIFSLNQKVISASYRRLAEALIDLQIPYEIADERILERYGKVENGKINIGNGYYSKIVIPETENITSSTLKFITEFVKQGGIAVCFTKYPERVNGVKTDLAEKEFSTLQIPLIQQRKGIIEKYFRKVNYERKISVTDKYGKLSSGLYLTYKKTKNGYNLALMNPSADATKEVLLNVNANGNITAYDVSTKKETLLNCIDLNGKTATRLIIAPKQCVRMRFYNGAAKHNDECEIVNTRTVPFKLTALYDNAITIDKGRYKIENGEYSNEISMVKASDVIYKEIEKQKNTVSLTLMYVFRCENASAKIQLIVETEKAKKIKINGFDIRVQTDKTFLDMDLRMYDISNKVKNGENIVEIEYEITPLRLGFDLNSVHDSVRNKFSYPVAIESIYLIGDFAVRSKTETAEEINFIRTAGDFVITEKSSLQAKGDLSRQGYYFYPFNAEYSCDILYEGGRAFLNIDYDGTAVVIYVNGKKVAVDYLAGENKEITQYLKKGTNDIKLTLLGSIRNLLGPHHHCKGEPEYTGVHSFTGEFGNGAVEDASAEEMPDKVWNDAYAFIRFGLNEITYINKI